MIFEKVEYLINTYKSSGLNNKLSKMTKWIFRHIYICLFHTQYQLLINNNNNNYFILVIVINDS